MSALFTTGNRAISIYKSKSDKRANFRIPRGNSEKLSLIFCVSGPIPNYIFVLLHWIALTNTDFDTTGGTK
jgi:hypothetical protein